MPLRCDTRLACAEDLEDLLPLIRGYQAFYAITQVDDSQTRAFFGGIISSSAESFIVVAHQAEQLVGFATGYMTLSGYLARRVVHMGDLFVQLEKRRQGIGRALIAGVCAEASARGLTIVRWLTHPANDTAHRLYDSLSAEPSDLRLYVLNLAVKEGGPAPGRPE